MLKSKNDTVTHPYKKAFVWFKICLVLFIFLYIGLDIYSNDKAACRLDHIYIRKDNIIYIKPTYEGVSGYKVLVKEGNTVKSYQIYNAVVLLDVKKGLPWLESTNFRKDCDLLELSHKTSTTIHIRNPQDIK